MLRRNMIELKANGHGVRSFEELVEQLGPDAVASPKRSTVPLLDYWRQPEPRLRVLEAHLGVTSSEVYDDLPRPCCTGTSYSK